MSRSLVLRLAATLAIPGCFNPTDQPAVDTDADDGTTTAPSDTTEPSASDATDPTDPTDPTASASSPDTGPGDTTTTPSTTDPDATATGDTSTADDGSGDDGSTSGGSETDDTSVTGDPSCDGQCAPEVPQGWQGPVVMYDGAAAPGPCPGAFPSAVHTDLHAGLDAGAALCDCACGDVNGASCGSATLREEGNLCIQFIQNPDTWVLQPGQCTLINAPADDYSLTPAALQVGGASCPPQPTEQIDAPSWDRNVRSCETAAGGACDGGTCYPAIPAEHSMCIYVAGEAACPEGPWSQVLVGHAGFEDDRDCTTCSCGTPAGTCGGSAILTSNGCGGGALFVDEIVANGCGMLAAASHATWTPEVDAACTPSGGTLTGEVTTTGAVTYCCL